MLKTPLRDYLDETGQTAERFAADKGLSAWSVRHWARGDKTPSLESQQELERATESAVTPAMWLAWKIASGDTSSVQAA